MVTWRPTLTPIEVSEIFGIAESITCCMHLNEHSYVRVPQKQPNDNNTIDLYIAFHGPQRRF